MTGPRVERTAGLPRRVRVYEVGPRDGLQAESGVIPTAVKIALCERLYAAGSEAVELTSFVPPSWIPQLADAEAVADGVAVPAGRRGIALVPNVRGLERAIAGGVAEVAVVVSATDSFSLANLNAPRMAALGRAIDVIDAARAASIAVRGYVSMAFGDPWEGEVDTSVVAETAAALFDAGCRTVALGDTIGVSTPGLTERVVSETMGTGVPLDAIALHLHDTYGQALANVLTALRMGVSEFDASVGGLGRCPYAKGATGNLATEDLVWMLEGLGIETGLDLAALAATSDWLAGIRGVAAPSSTARAIAALAADGEDTAGPSPVSQTNEEAIA